MSYLKILPVQSLKIDKIFVDDIEQSAQEKLIFNAIAELGKALGLTVISEGVENQYQVDYILNSKADMLQGFYFSKPLSTEVATTLLLKQGCKPATSVEASKCGGGEEIDQ